MPLIPIAGKANRFEPWFNVFFYSVVTAALLLAAFMPLKNYGVFDDAYMFLRYADNLTRGGTYGWNLHEKTYGCTSIPYTFFIWLLQQLGVGRHTTPSQFIVFASFFWGLAFLVLFYHTLNLLIKDNKWFTPPILKGFFLLVILMPIFLPHFFSGMDTTISLFADTLMIFAFLVWKQSPSTLKLILAGTAAYLTFLVRPDNLIYAVLFPFLFLVGNKTSLRETAMVCAVIGGLLILDTFAKWAYFGNPLPLPFYAKKSGFYAGYIGIGKWNNMEYLTTFALCYGTPLLVFYVMVFSRASLRQAAIFLIPFILTLAYLSTVVQIMGSQARYYIPSIPFLMGGLIRGLAGSLSSQTVFPNRRIVIAVTIVAGLLFSSNYIPSLYMAMKMKKARTQASIVSNEDSASHASQFAVSDPGLKARNDLNDFLLHYPGKIKIAASEYGYIGACNPDIPILDLCGLHNKAIATTGYHDSDLESFAPDLIWMVHTDYTVLYHQITIGRYFREAYEFYPDLLAFGLAIKRSSPYYTQIKEQLVKNTSNTPAILPAGPAGK